MPRFKIPKVPDDGTPVTIGATENDWAYEMFGSRKNERENRDEAVRRLWAICQAVEDPGDWVPVRTNCDLKTEARFMASMVHRLCLPVPVMIAIRPNGDAQFRGLGKSVFLRTEWQTARNG